LSGAAKFDLKYFRTANPSDANDVDSVEVDNGTMESDNDSVADPEEDIVMLKD
jgi:hypothetical protein